MEPLKSKELFIMSRVSKDRQYGSIANAQIYDIMRIDTTPPSLSHGSIPPLCLLPLHDLFPLRNHIRVEDI